MEINSASLETRIATSDQDLMAAARLRYRVFVEELGGDGDLIDHTNRLEMDRYDPFLKQLVLIDKDQDPANLDHVVGVYRLMDGEGAKAAGQYYTADEYDLAPLLGSGRSLLELGRSCIDQRLRGSPALFMMWNALAVYVEEQGFDLLFGVASFHGTDVEAIAPSLSLLHHEFLAPKTLRVRANEASYQEMNLLQQGAYNRAEAMRAVPALLKSYLRLGGRVGEGAFVDHAFNTVDVCLILDVQAIDAAAAARFAGRSA